MELIDSKYTREKYKELGVEFTDWQKAAIIWNKPMPHQECLNALKELADKTADSELKKQIEDIEEMRIFKIQIVKGTDIPMIRNCNRWNPNLFPEKTEIEEYYREYSDGEIGEVCISLDGTIRYWGSTETTDEEDMVLRTAKAYADSERKLSEIGERACNATRIRDILW